MQLKDQKLFRQQCYVNGAWVGALNRGTIPVTNPATGETLGTVPRMGAEETRQAIEAADRALPAWRGKTAKERAQILRKWFDLMMANQEDLATLMTAEQGKPMVELRGEIAYAASFIEWFGEEGKRVYGDTIPAHASDKRIVVTKEPIGVCAAITPWNFPAAMITRKAGPALAAGCTMVLKPATATPFSALALCELAERAGVPKGVFSCVTGPSNEIGGELTSNPTVRKLTFTGSTEIGKLLMQQCAGTVKKLSLELGGNAPFIVFDDADIEMAVKGAIASKYRNAGQTCVCANRILVQDGVYDAFTKRLAETAGAMKVADGFEPGAVIGPLIDMKAVEKVEAHIADAVKKGAKIVTGGKRAAQGGSFFEPTVLTDVTTDMVITKEETFGPGRPALPLQERRRGRQDGQRHRVRPRLLFLQPRHRPHLAGRRSPRIRHRRHQRRHHLDRDRPFRRHEGKRHRPRRLEIRHRGIPRSQIPLHGRHRPLARSDRASRSP